MNHLLKKISDMSEASLRKKSKEELIFYIKDLCVEITIIDEALDYISCDIQLILDGKANRVHDNP